MRRAALLLALMASGCADQGMDDLSYQSLEQFEGMKLATEEAKRSGKVAVFQPNTKIRHRRCSDERAMIVECSYEMHYSINLSEWHYSDWKPVKRTFKNTFWTQGWVEAEAASR